MLRSVLDNEAGPARDIVILNAGVALYAANVAGDDRRGHRAWRARRWPRGKALAKLHQFVAREGTGRGMSDILTRSSRSSARRCAAAPAPCRRSLAAPRGRRGAGGQRATSSARLRAKIAAGRAGVIAEVKKASPAGRAARALRAGRDRRQLRARRRGLPERADRRAVLPGLGRVPAAGRAPPARCRCCARISWSTPTRWLGGARDGRRLHPADRRLPGRCADGRLEAQARRSAWRCWSRCTTAPNWSARCA